jgi:hypothetical protein
MRMLRNCKRQRNRPWTGTRATHIREIANARFRSTQLWNFRCHFQRSDSTAGNCQLEPEVKADLQSTATRNALQSLVNPYALCSKGTGRLMS